MPIKYQVNYQLIPSMKAESAIVLPLIFDDCFLNTAHSGHDIIVLNTKGNNEQFTKSLCNTDTVFSPYYHKMPDAV